MWTPGQHGFKSGLKHGAIQIGDKDMELSREYFQECGRKGGEAGDPEKKRAAMSGELGKTIAEINRTRRHVEGHIPECDCEFCVRYKAAKATLARLRGG